jgi:hypothetical protein
VAVCCHWIYQYGKCYRYPRLTELVLRHMNVNANLEDTTSPLSFCAVLPMKTFLEQYQRGLARLLLKWSPIATGTANVAQSVVTIKKSYSDHLFHLFIYWQRLSFHSCRCFVPYDTMAPIVVSAVRAIVDRDLVAVVSNDPTGDPRRHRGMSQWM